MARCRMVSEQLTAWADGQLGSFTRGRVDKHLRSCTLCTAEAQSIQAAIRAQSRDLHQLVRSTDVNVDRIWHAVLRERAVAPHRASFLLTWMRPLAFAVCVLTLSVVGYFGSAPTPETVLVPLGIKSPPAAISQAPVLFKDYPVIEKLDMLEHFDTVDSIPLDLDDDAASENS